MINAKGEWIYTNAEIAYELGISPSTVNAIGKRLFGTRVPHWNIQDVKLIAEYLKSISVEEEARRMQLLHDTIASVGFEPFNETELKQKIDKDIYLKTENYTGR